MAERSIIKLKDDRLAEILTDLHSDEAWLQFWSGEAIREDAETERRIRIALAGAEACAFVDADTLQFVTPDGRDTELVSLELGVCAGILEQPRGVKFIPPGPDGESAVWLDN